MSTDFLTLLAVLTIFVKGVLLPRLLLRAIRRVEIRREMEPLVGYTASLVLGAVALGAAAFVSATLSLPSRRASSAKRAK